MKELTNEEIEKLAELIGNHSPYELARLVGGDLSHIGRGILEGRRVSGGSCGFLKPSSYLYKGDKSDYSLSPIPVKAMHYGDEVIEGLVSTCTDGTPCLTIKFKDIGFRNRFINKLQKKEIK